MKTQKSIDVSVIEIDFINWWEQEGKEMIKLINIISLESDIKILCEIAWKNSSYKTIIRMNEKR